jgi:hypothetical protein
MKFTKKLLAAALLSASTAVLAEPIPLPGGLVLLSDNDAEYLINADPTSTDTTLDKGDRLRGIFTINTIEGLNPASPEVTQPFGGNFLSGIFDITVVTVQTFGGQFFYTFAATDSSLSGFGSDATAIEMYYDPSNDYNRESCTIAQCEANVTDGTLWASFSVVSWTAQASSNDISVIGATTPPLPGGTYASALDFIVNNTGYTFLDHFCSSPLNVNAQVCASGSLLGTAGVDTPFDSFSNVDFTVAVAVPEPGSLVLLGTGLLAWAGFSRRRLSK